MSRVTALDVARRAGVSRSAVSRTFTPGASVAPTTADKVREAATELGYRPNVLARAMLTGQSRIIGLVVGYLDNQFYPQALQQLSAALDSEGYHVLVFLATNVDRTVDEIVEDILAYQVDGLVLASVALSSDLAQRCRASGVPVVLFNRRQGVDNELAVVSENRRGGQLAAEHLLSLGRRRIGYVAGWEGASTQIEREAGFVETLRAAGLDLYARGVGNFHRDQACTATRQMFDRPDPPDAVFVGNDHMAFAVMDVLRSELGLRVPQDVAVIGFDDVPEASWAGYDLTTIRQDSAAMVDATVAALLGETDPAGTIEIPVELIVRSSTRG
ncbi:LacI family DNA-binding transcriptional regulator [Thalassococcus sp. CAU 1522]|uniref:LacI family DNA-binding transcriptional regulator n=1 Tax=Thalassococcus arenae TaxID=2851652 RepID=A0ABS6N7B1_9RHOB|nr:LacI family DNA-binding transcriptional regulator [Thalassococcus arenae]MBV2359567.1 LacI family DNA-binding transcriptional regulator [Thalassococcus arenae]